MEITSPLLNSVKEVKGLPDRGNSGLNYEQKNEKWVKRKRKRKSRGVWLQRLSKCRSFDNSGNLTVCFPLDCQNTISAHSPPPSSLHGWDTEAVCCAQPMISTSSTTAQSKSLGNKESISMPN